MAMMYIVMLFTMLFSTTDDKNGNYVTQRSMPRIRGALAADRLQSIDYRFTVRDFMWAGCMKPSVLSTLWPASKKSHRVVAHRSYEQTMDTEMYRQYCPLWKDILENRVSAHPDFEVDSRYYAMGTSGVGKTFQTPVLLDGSRVEHAPRWHCNLDDIVRPTLVVDSAGLSKPQFLSRGRCSNTSSSQFEEFSISGEEYFSSW
jgi:hypothetical protein